MSEATKPAAERASLAKVKSEEDETRAIGLPVRNGQASAAGTLHAFGEQKPTLPD